MDTCASNPLTSAVVREGSRTWLSSWLSNTHGCRSHDAGGVLVIEGGAGIGKTSLLGGLQSE